VTGDTDQSEKNDLEEKNISRSINSARFSFLRRSICISTWKQLCIQLSAT